LDFIVQIAVRGEYTAKISELMHFIERITVDCEGGMCSRVHGLG